MLKVNNLTKFLNGIKILDNINIHVKKGSIYGLIGPNGAGKSTLIKNIVDIYTPDEGTILIDNENIHENIEKKSYMGYVPDSINYYPRFKIKDIVKIYRSTYPSWNEARYKKLKEIFNLDENKIISKLSKGMKMQLAIHLNLSIMPKILIMDEPTSGLDPIKRQEVLNLLVQEVSLNETTVLISSHNLAELEQICDHFGIIKEGKIIIETNIEDLKENIKKIQVVFPNELPEKIINHPNILKIETVGRVNYIIARENPEEIINTLKKYNPLVLDTLNMTLQEIFIYEMGGKGYELKDITL